MVSGDTERTRLANERTYLAWWRSGIAALAAGFAIGRIVPEVVDGSSWPYVALGAALVGAGVVAIASGLVRFRELDAALRQGREPRTSDAVLVVLAGVGIAVGIVSILLVLLAP
jgi:putative membrane protein